MTTTLAHPTWCDPRYCTTTDIDVAHSSEPVAWSTRDANITLALVRAYEARFPGEWDRPPEPAVEVESTVVEGMPTRMYLDMRELRQLIDALTRVGRAYSS